MEKAEEKFEEALKVAPSLEVAKIALQVIEDVTDQKMDKKAAIHFFKGEVYGSKEKWDKAIAEYDKAIEANPRFALAYRNRGATYAQGRGQYNKAIADCNKAIEINFSGTALPMTRY